MSSNFERTNGLSKEEMDSIIRVKELLTYEIDMHDKRVILVYEKREMKRISPRFTGFVTFKRPEKDKLSTRLTTRVRKPKESFIELVAQVKSTRISHMEKW